MKDNNSKKYLTQMLETYEKNLEAVDQFIDQSQEQLKGAAEQRIIFEQDLQQLKALIGTTDEEDSAEEEAKEA